MTTNAERLARIGELLRVRGLIIALVLTAPLLASCAADTVAPTPQPPAQMNAPRGVLEPGEALGFEPEAVGTPEDNPKLFIHVAPIDEETGKPVTVPVKVPLDGRGLIAGLREYSFELPGTMAERTELAVEAKGYERWSLFLRYKLTNTRSWDVPVKLTPLPRLPATSGKL